MGRRVAASTKTLLGILVSRDPIESPRNAGIVSELIDPCRVYDTQAVGVRYLRHASPLNFLLAARRSPLRSIDSQPGIDRTAR